MITKILIAEDDPMMARLYEKVFNFEGYQVEMAGDGQAAVDKARENPPTLIVLDVMMPKLNGLAALEQIKADPKLKNTPVVMLTNLAGEQDAENALAKGAAKYIIKSEHDPREVAMLVKEVLTSAPPIPLAGPGAPAAATPPAPPPTAAPAAAAATPPPATPPTPAPPAPTDPAAPPATPPPSSPPAPPATPPPPAA